MVKTIKKVVMTAIVMLSLLLAVGCSKNAASSPIIESTMNTAEVLTFMESTVSSPIQGYAIADGQYAMPSEAWINGQYSLDLKAFQFELKASHWVAEANDCDDFARGAAYFSQVLHHNTPHKTVTGLLFGEFWYYKDDGSGGHAINFSIVNDSKTKKPKIIFYEPQLQYQVTLSTNEMWNCIHWRL
jgi:hypothetical protein